MRQFHPGLYAFFELYVEDVETYLAEYFKPLASEEVSRKTPRLRPQSDGYACGAGPIDLARVAPIGRA